jgi:DNA-binding transcriptional MerR regulator
MKIGEIARRTGMAASAIRFYEERGLLVSVGRGSNGYRDYSEEDVERLERIKIGKALGFSIEDMGNFFSGGDNISKPDMLRSLDLRMAEVDQMVKMLNAQRRDLQALRQHLLDTWENGECFKAAPKPKPKPTPQATSKGVRRPA